jgi:hypothetical protein
MKTLLQMEMYYLSEYTPTFRFLKITSLYVALTNEWNVAKNEKNIDEWFNLLRDIMLLRKNQLLTSYSLKNYVTDNILLFKICYRVIVAYLAFWTLKR